MFTAEFTPVRTAMPALKRAFDNKIQQAALRATDRAATKAKEQIRSDMAAAGLGKLGMALGSGSDLKKGGRVHRQGDGWSVSGWVFVRSGSKRSRGAIEAYTQGAEIKPRKGRWLWIPSRDIQRLVGKGRDRRRLTPALWNENGLDTRIGPLQLVPNINGRPLLVVKTGAVAATGRARSLRGRLKSGKAPRGFVNREFVVAFIGIPYTSRQARARPAEIARKVAADMSRDFILTTSTGAQ
jgi:hypothetical protein